MEYIGGDSGNLPVYGTLHYSHSNQCYQNSQSGGNSNEDGTNFLNGFHNYTVEWYPDHIDWFVDEDVSFSRHLTE